MEKLLVTLQEIFSIDRKYVRSWINNREIVFQMNSRSRAIRYAKEKHSLMTKKLHERLLKLSKKKKPVQKDGCLLSVDVKLWMIITLEQS